VLCTSALFLVGSNNNNEVYVEDTVVDEFGVSHVLLRRLSVVSTPMTCPLQSSANQSFRSKEQKLRDKTVTIEEEEETDRVDVDILVLLPERDSDRDGQWLLESLRT